MKYLILSACLVATPALAASGQMLKDEDMRAAANLKAASVGQVAKGAKVDVLGRQGGWTQISSGGRTGWVRILSVRTTVESGGDLSGLVQAGTRRSDSSRVVATAGLRGLSEEELKSAHYDAAELARLDRYMVDRGAAEQFARAAGLRSISLDYLPEPQAKHEQKNTPASGGGFNFM
jgi:hypothetical protein